MTSNTNLTGVLLAVDQHGSAMESEASCQIWELFISNAMAWRALPLPSFEEVVERVYWNIRIGNDLTPSLWEIRTIVRVLRGQAWL